MLAQEIGQPGAGAPAAPAYLAKFGALTSLRFVAAVLVIVSHFVGYFGIPAIFATYPFYQTVTFFFLLSGFILTYRYGGLNRGQVSRFLVTRAARIWPLHLATLALCLGLTPRFTWPNPRLSPELVLPQVCLVHTWLPLPDLIRCSFNSPSWSIATEFFFYLCFPLLLVNWSRTWASIALAFLAALGMVYLAVHPPAILSGRVAPLTLCYTHPIARLWEFILGMTIAHLWRRYHSAVRLSRWWGTVLEIAAVGLASAAHSGGLHRPLVRAHQAHRPERCHLVADHRYLRCPLRRAHLRHGPGAGTFRDC